MSGGYTNLGSPLDYNLDTLTDFSPANFESADDTRPNEIAMDPTGQGVTAPYSLLVGNVMARQTAEIRERALPPMAIPGNWKKKMREFMIQKNEDILHFLRKPLSQHPTLSQAEQFMKRFGKQDFLVHTNSLQQVLFDTSGVDMTHAIQEELKKVGPAAPAQIVEEVKWLYEQYKLAGEEVMKCDSQLKLKLDVLDKSYQKLLGFMELPVNEDTTTLQTAIQTYMDGVMKEHSLEKTYTDMMEAYRRFATLRQTIDFFRFLDLADKEPLCSICLQEPVGFALSPCGHTFCITCSKRQMTVCYMCRAQIRERIRIYFG